jgi:broad specificity phosphatase PhoE
MGELELQNAERVAILARHGRTHSNAAGKAGRVQGLGSESYLDKTGERQACALGLAVGRFAAQHNLRIEGVYSSDAPRALRTRDLALEQIDLTLRSHDPDPRLREVRKGELEGELRTIAYPNEDVKRTYEIDWHARYGRQDMGGETAYEAGCRWLEWFKDVTQSMVRGKGSDTIPSLLVFGHGQVMSYGLWMLTYAGAGLGPLEKTRALRTENCTALVVVEEQGEWNILSERIVPTEVDFELAS